MTNSLLALVLACAAALGALFPQASGLATYNIPITYFKLPNGLKVVLSRDPSRQIVTVQVHYGIGARVEPKNRTGFAHLFEHLLMRASEGITPGGTHRLMQRSGGMQGGYTRDDVMVVFGAVPAHNIEVALWARAVAFCPLGLTPEGLESACVG